MANFEELARPAVAELSERGEDELYQELALRVKGMFEEPSVAGELQPSVPYSPELLGPLDDLQDFGRRFFARFLPEAYKLACGEDAQERKKIEDAFGISPEAVGAAIAGILVAQFAIAPAAAAVIGALILRLFFRPAYQAMCDVWKEKLPAEA